jgi:DNA-binding NarL/FixJ family response regulator
MTKVIIADSLPVVTSGLQMYFKANPGIEIIDTIDNFDTLQSIIKSEKADVLVLDLELQGLSSIKELRTLVEELNKTRVVLFTNVSEKMYAPIAFKYGISGFVSKKSGLDKLATVIAAVGNGNTVFSEDVLRIVETLNKGKKAERLFKKLSNRESEVLRYLNDGLKNKEIAKVLNLDEKTISTYKLRLLAKLSATNLVELLKNAKDLGAL